MIRQFGCAVERVFGSALIDRPAMPAHIIAAVNVPWEDDYGETFYPEGQQVLSYDANRNNILASQLLSQNVPVVIGSLGHATVLTAMSWAEDIYGKYVVKSFTVRDPIYGKRQYSAAEVGFANFMAVVRV